MGMSPIKSRVGVSLIKSRMGMGPEGKEPNGNEFANNFAQIKTALRPGSRKQVSMDGLTTCLNLGKFVSLAPMTKKRL